MSHTKEFYFHFFCRKGEPAVVFFGSFILNSNSCVFFVCMCVCLFYLHFLSVRTGTKQIDTRKCKANSRIKQRAFSILLRREPTLHGRSREHLSKILADNLRTPGPKRLPTSYNAFSCTDTVTSTISSVVRCSLFCRCTAHLCGRTYREVNAIRTPLELLRALPQGFFF